MKIGIFGGTFNPVHSDHLLLVNKLIDLKLLDKILFVPTGDSYERKNSLSPLKRIEMLKLALKNNNNLLISDYEINEKHYTFETLHYFKKLYSKDEIYFICGSDNYKDIVTWKNYKYVLENFKIIVILRNDLQKDLENLYEKINKTVYFIEFKSSISSTQIRDRIIKKESKNIERYLNKDVFKYINENNLYEDS